MNIITASCFWKSYFFLCRWNSKNQGLNPSDCKSSCTACPQLHSQLCARRACPFCPQADRQAPGRWVWQPLQALPPPLSGPPRAIPAGEGCCWRRLGAPLRCSEKAARSCGSCLIPVYSWRSRRSSCLSLSANWFKYRPIILCLTCMHSPQLALGEVHTESSKTASKLVQPPCILWGLNSPTILANRLLDSGSRSSCSSHIVLWLHRGLPSDCKPLFLLAPRCVPLRLLYLCRSDWPQFWISGVELCVSSSCDQALYGIIVPMTQSLVKLDAVRMLPSFAKIL